MARNKLLKSKIEGDSAALASTLYGANLGETEKTLKRYSQEELASLHGSREDDADQDSGSFEMWKSANQDEVAAMFVFALDKAPLRRTGYVTWYGARGSEDNMMDLFEEIMSMPERSLQPIDEEWDEMQTSLDKRSRIWQRGGRGDWSKGDESRIVWRGGSNGGD
ncbi:hypothetical protein A1O7_05800 [Cladophialophora yegresii CBS 114405]|uniref:Uncharacterized protein n=1 Tax=Cladophialophora yegresii CBS 114405 TaxID=1182544 RepID=W9W091_9EURO|nr:uncharacterized protein A1O7_05800 [Cladophialophora yegresii CBS 114405]EXJ58375.1 hypothetical protein A1O7_05800 [Cladophialophora yegresii CBS 114405]